MKNIIKNKKILISLIIVLIAIITFVVVKFFNGKNKINEVSNDNYLFQYDSSWELSKREDLEAKLVHKKSKSELEITISELENENQYKPIDEVFDSFLYNIQKQNENYKLIYKEQTKLTSNEIDGYKMLFEENDNQVGLYLYKQANKLVTFEYKATTGYFDILLDSVNSIIYNFKLKEKTFDVKTYIDIETKKIEYTDQAEVTNLLNDEKEDKIAKSNYLVEYSIPANFKEVSYNSRYITYNFENLPDKTSMKLSTNIYQKNIYEYLDKKSSSNLYKEYDTVRADRDLTEALDKNSDSPLSYIYKNHYKKDGNEYENLVIIYELDQNHIFTLEVSATGVFIPEKLAQMLKIKEFRNIASNTENKKENGFLTGTLKRFLKDKKTEEITLKLPEDFKEIDDDFTNMFTKRNYICNYDNNLKVSDYEVIYEVSPTSIENKIKTLSDEYKTNFSQLENVTLNGKNFAVYETNYDRTSSVNYTNGIKYKYNTKDRVLFYELQDNSYLIIEIKANEKDITDEILNKLTNFDVDIK